MTEVYDNAPFKPVILSPNLQNQYYVDPRLKRTFDGIVSNIKNIGKFGELGNRGYMFTGSPGTGKTLGVKYLAQRVNAPMYALSDLNPEYISEFFAYMRSISHSSPAIAFIDETDRFSSRDNIGSSSASLGALLDNLDGVAPNGNLFIFGASNRQNDVDNALRRPGRLSKEVDFLPPGLDGRRHILELHAYQFGAQFKFDEKHLDAVASRTFGYTGADLRGLCNEALEDCVLKNIESTNPLLEVTMENFEYALKHTLPTALKDMPFMEPTINLKDIGGYEFHKELMKRVIENSPQGSMSLFYGLPGTGKTRLAEAIAGEYGLNCMFVSGSELENSLVGETQKKIIQVMNRAKSLAPVVLVFDEMDSFVGNGNSNFDYRSMWTGLLQSKLSKPIEDVHIISTMNKPHVIKDALLQRFQNKLYFGMPSPEEQKAIWRIHVPEVNPDNLLAVNNNLSGRDIAQMVSQARIFGLPQTDEMYTRLVAGRKASNEGAILYENMKDEVGDSVEDFKKAKPLMTGDKK